MSFDNLLMVLCHLRKLFNVIKVSDIMRRGEGRTRELAIAENARSKRCNENIPE